MKVDFQIVATVEGSLDEVIDTSPPVNFPPLQEVLGTLRNLAFIVEQSPFLKDNQTAQNTAQDANRILAAFRPA